MDRPCPRRSIRGPRHKVGGLPVEGGLRIPGAGESGPGDGELHVRRPGEDGRCGQEAGSILRPASPLRRRAPTYNGAGCRPRLRHVRLGQLHPVRPERPVHEPQRGPDPGSDEVSPLQLRRMRKDQCEGLARGRRTRKDQAGSDPQPVHAQGGGRILQRGHRRRQAVGPGGGEVAGAPEAPRRFCRAVETPRPHHDGYSSAQRQGNDDSIRTRPGKTRARFGERTTREDPEKDVTGGCPPLVVGLCPSREEGAPDRQFDGGVRHVQDPPGPGDLSCGTRFYLPVHAGRHCRRRGQADEREGRRGLAQEARI